MLLHALALFAALYRPDVVVELPGKANLVIRSIRLAERNQFSTYPELSFEIISEQPAWDEIKLAFQIGVSCSSKAAVMTTSIQLSHSNTKYKTVVEHPFDDTRCRIEAVRATVPGHSVKQDLSVAEIQKLIAEREAEEEAVRKEAAAFRAQAAAAAAAAAEQERRRVRAVCRAVYQSTVRKRIGDLTVGEEQQVRACQALGLYPPR